MKYFFDTEFIEDFSKPLLGKRRHFIDLINIGIVAEDGREYYAISKDFNPNDASDLVKKNVITNLKYQETFEHDRNYSKVYEGWEAVKKIGKSNKQIAAEIIAFTNPEPENQQPGYFHLHNCTISDNQFLPRPEFYAYYADYDWVVFCSLFGRMIDLPKGFPMYCRDLKQTIDELAMHYVVKENNSFDMRAALEGIKGRPDYPFNHDEHNALADAKWNFELYKFLQNQPR